MAKGRRRPTSGGGAKPKPAKTRESRRDRPTRDERIAAERRARKRREMRNRVIVGVVLALVVGGLAFRFVQGRRASDRRVAAVTQGSCRFDRSSDSGRGHVPSPSFRVNPPSGGDHSAQAIGPRQYTEPPADGSVVHALEHGDVVIWHRPGVAAEDLAAIERVADTYSEDVLTVPRDGLPTPVVATAWERRLLCEQTEEETLRRFVVQYRNEAPEQV